MVPAATSLPRVWPAALVLLASCATVRGLPGRELALPGRAPLSGPIVGLTPRALADNRDFTYAVELSGPPAALAWTHLGAKEFRLGLWALDPAPRPLADVALNGVEADVEALAFSPDGTQVAAASRDGSLRVFDSATGKLLRRAQGDEPLSAVAWSPDGRHLATGSAGGLLTVFEARALGFGAARRAHRDEVRALAFDDSGALWSGGWDKAIVRFELRLARRTVSEARARFELLGNHRVLAVSLGEATLRFAVDARAATSALTARAATAAGIDLAALGESRTVQTPAGEALARLAGETRLGIEALRMALPLAVCDACVPAGVDGVLGVDLLARYELLFDETAGEARLRALAPADATEAELPALEERARFDYPLFVNDLSVSRDGTRLGVAFGESKAERSYEVYQREKQGIVEPLREANCAAMVEARTGAIARRFVAHHGVVATAAISPDSASLASGGWDNRLLVFSGPGERPVFEERFGWSVRRVRFSRDGRYLAVGAWTPQKASASAESDPAAIVYDVRYPAPGAQ